MLLQLLFELHRLRFKYRLVPLSLSVCVVLLVLHLVFRKHPEAIVWLLKVFFLQITMIESETRRLSACQFSSCFFVAGYYCWLLFFVHER